MKFQLLLFITITFSLVVAADDTLSELDVVNAVIDDFHLAAAQGDKTRYLGLMTDDRKRVRLTRAGLFVSDAIWPHFLRQ